MSLVPLPTDVTEGGKTVLVDSRIKAVVVQIARAFGVKVSSGYRDPAHNAEVGGAPQSDHLTGGAVDFVGGNLSKLYNWATGAGFPYVEPMSQSQGHVHISFLRGGSVPAAAGSSVPAGMASQTTAGGCAPALLAIAIYGYAVGMVAYHLLG